MTEKELENRLAETLSRADDDRNVLRTLHITASTGPAATLYDLIGDHPFELFKDTSDWNTDIKSKFMTDVAGGITPDLVIQSKASGQNRIYTEVKLHEEIRDVPALSQITRQFLHLLATTQSAPLPGRPDINRALLLAAPSAWFAVDANRAKWRYFLDHYTDLAQLPKINITLGELRLDFLL
jgi:hypothetical protein